MTLYVYAVGPIDFWFGWMPLHKVYKAIRRANADGGVDGWLEVSSGEVAKRLGRAQDMARHLGWEGDIRPGEGPFFAPIPYETGCYEFLLAWKQDNNGDTFVASPVRLPWLEDGATAIDDKGRHYSFETRPRVAVSGTI